ncbi:ribosomal protein S5 domain 2-type protein [Cantharellus anzutake]|uniref:ribosomal protein S5 domain 2-type protein n=1 Tax=Cantharellus anzutake TaxID=1750568 RepID=UPI0019062A9D|nr:ribosomal protein S5 domain 2-type protein [Cantharellus anzutake]KAF8324571.1 ribosomal protein S5 domain 2-type protein [Cantharellus anzutake]
MSTSLQALTFQRLHPRAYLERFLAEGVRPDGRGDSSWRDISVNSGSISTADGSALVRLGDTTIVCGVKAEVAEPDIDHPASGFIVPNVDLSAMCSPLFKTGPPGEEAQIISQYIYGTLLSSEFLPLKSLAIEPGKAVWCLYIDAACINYDGNALDATLLAVVTALKNTQLPTATFSETTGRTTISRTLSAPLSLNFARTPSSFTFGHFKPSSSPLPNSVPESFFLADLTSFEEPLMESTLAVVMYPNGDIGGITQTGVIDTVTSLPQGERGVTGSYDAITRATLLAKSQLASLHKQKLM